MAMAEPAMTFLRPMRSESAPMKGMAMQMTTRLQAVTSSASPMVKLSCLPLRNVGM